MIHPTGKFERQSVQLNKKAAAVQPGRHTENPAAKHTSNFKGRYSIGLQNGYREPKRVKKGYQLPQIPLSPTVGRLECYRIQNLIRYQQDGLCTRITLSVIIQKLHDQIENVFLFLLSDGIQAKFDGMICLPGKMVCLPDEMIHIS